MIVQQPYSIFPDPRDLTLEGAWYNRSVIGTSRDSSDNLKNATPTGISYLDVGAGFTAGDFVIASTTFTTQAYSIQESGIWNRYVDNGSQIYLNGAATGSKPLDITATGFTGETVKVMDIEVYNIALDSGWAIEDFRKRVSDSSLILLVSDDVKDISRYRRVLTLAGAVIGSKTILTAGGITWPSITGFQSYAYWWKSSATAAWRHYGSNGTVDYDNGSPGGTLPFTIAATGFSGETGTIQNLIAWDEVKDESIFQTLYESQRGQV